MFDPAINPAVFRNPRHFLAFGMGAGLARRAPGTWGTLAACPWCVLAWWGLPVWAYGALLLAAALVGVWLCDTVARDLRVHDHGGIVWDEWVGYGLGLFALPPAWYWPLAAFALFRLLDIAKPWPIRWCDRHVHGGVGIMLDDILAGVLAAAVLHAVRVGWAL